MSVSSKRSVTPGGRVGKLSSGSMTDPYKERVTKFGVALKSAHSARNSIR